MSIALLVLVSCRSPEQRRIAMVPRTTGSTLWEAEHTGANIAAAHLGYSIYWNGPTHEDDVEGQLALLEQIRKSKFQGVVLAPDHSLAVLTSIRRFAAAGIPVVVVSSPLALPPGKNLTYIVNDYRKTGRLVASRLSSILHADGEIAILGADPDITGILLTMDSLERELQTHAPGLRVVARGPGAFNAAEGQQATLAVLAAHPKLQAIVCLTAVSLRAAYFTLRARRQLQAIRLIGFEQDTEMIEAVKQGEIDSVIAEDTYAMGAKAVQEIAAERQGRAVPPVQVLAPVLITADKVNSPDVTRLTSMEWFRIK